MYHLWTPSYNKEAHNLHSLPLSPSLSLSLSPSHAHTQSQAAVKESKARFDKLKVDLTEKIGMVNASRCNLLSRSLPTYQKSMLTFSDSAASEFHRVLVDLRSHHHHQYKLHSDLEQIRDLESEELNESSLFSSIEGGSSFLPPQSAGNDDDDLIDVSSPVSGTRSDKDTDKKTEVGREAVEGSDRLVPVSPPAAQTKKEGAADNLPLTGVEADLQALQNELLQEFGSSGPPDTVPSAMKEGKSAEEMGGSFGPANMDLNDLLGLGLGLEGEEGANVPDFGPMVSSEGVVTEQQDGVKSSDVLTDQWNNFSSFMKTTRTPTKTSLSEWEKEFTEQPSTPKEDPFLELDPLAASKKQGTSSGSKGGGGESSGLADDLRSLSTGSTSGLSPTPQLPLVPMQTAPPPLSLASGPSLSSGPGQGMVGGIIQGKPHPPAPSVRGAATKEPEKKGTSWMNVFAHLDPLSNEKA